MSAARRATPGRPARADRPAVEFSLDDLRHAGRWAARCVDRVLPLFEAAAPGDRRPHAAVAGIREFAAGRPRTATLRSVAWGAFAASRQTADSAAAAAARAAMLAAAVAYTHPLATPHQTKHVLGPAVYAALAKERAAGDPAAAARELRLALTRAPRRVRALVRRMTPVPAGTTRLSVLFHELDEALRGTRRPGRRATATAGGTAGRRRRPT